MIPNNTPYYLESILDRLDAILGSETDAVYLPSPFSLDSMDYSHTYVTKIICMAISLPYPALSIDSSYKQYQIYKALLSEISSILNENNRILDVDFSSSNKILVLMQLPEGQYDGIIDLSAKISSVIRIVDRRARSKGFLPFNVVIGIDAGNSYVTHETIEPSLNRELLWMGKTQIEAVRLASLLQLGDIPIIISERVFNNLSAKYKSFFTRDNLNDIYVSSLRNNAVAAWMEQNLQK